MDQQKINVANISRELTPKQIVEQLDTDRTECISVANKYRRGDVLTSDEMALLGEGMVKGWVRIVASMSLENTNVQFTSEALPTSNSANMVLTYSRR